MRQKCQTAVIYLIVNALQLDLWTEKPYCRYGMVEAIEGLYFGMADP